MELTFEQKTKLLDEAIEIRRMGAHLESCHNGYAAGQEGRFAELLFYIRKSKAFEMREYVKSESHGDLRQIMRRLTNATQDMPTDSGDDSKVESPCSVLELINADRESCSGYKLIVASVFVLEAAMVRLLVIAVTSVGDVIALGVEELVTDSFNTLESACDEIREIPEVMNYLSEVAVRKFMHGMDETSGAPSATSDKLAVKLRNEESEVDDIGQDEEIAVVQSKIVTCKGGLSKLQIAELYVEAKRFTIDDDDYNSKGLPKRNHFWHLLRRAGDCGDAAIRGIWNGLIPIGLAKDLGCADPISVEAKGRSNIAMRIKLHEGKLAEMEILVAS